MPVLLMLCEPTWVWKQYNHIDAGHLSSQKALMRGTTVNGHYPNLSTMCTQLHCFLTWAGLSAQRRALPCRLMNLGSPTPPQGPRSRLCVVVDRLEGLWEVCRQIELLGILLLQMIQHALEWEPVALCVHSFSAPHS